MEEEEAHKLFQHFQRVDAAAKHKQARLHLLVQLGLNESFLPIRER